MKNFCLKQHEWVIKFGYTRQIATVVIDEDNTNDGAKQDDKLFLV